MANVYIILSNYYLQMIMTHAEHFCSDLYKLTLYRLLSYILYTYLLYITNVFIAFHRNHTDRTIEINVLDNTIVNRHTHYYTK